MWFTASDRFFILDGEGKFQIDREFNKNSHQIKISFWEAWSCLYMINYTYKNLTLCWNLLLQTSISAHFNRFAKWSTAVLWLWSKAKKRRVSSSKDICLYSIILTWYFGSKWRFSSLHQFKKKNNDLEEHNNCLAK